MTFGKIVLTMVPSMITKEMASEMNAEYREKILSQIPLGRLGQVQETADIVCFLLSPAASHVTGQDWAVDGGVLETLEGYLITD